MNYCALNNRNADMVTEVHRVMRQRVINILARMAELGEIPRIQCAYRTPAEQRALFYEQRSALRWGFHNVTEGGQPAALAVDILDNTAPRSLSLSFLLKLAWCAQRENCETGILWGLREGQRVRIASLVENRQFDQPAKIGWDPCHVQPSDLTVGQAQAGLMPFAAAELIEELAMPLFGGHKHELMNNAEFNATSARGAALAVIRDGY